MKYVIKTLLFVNLLLQMTGTLRKCFDQDQNLMLTIILLAFSIIGIIGLIVGNRFILIIFAACMTLIFIASIVIYAYGRSESNSLRPKVPYYIDAPIDSQASSHKGDKGNQGDSNNRLKSLVNKLLSKSQQHETGKNKKGNRRQNKTRLGLDPNERNSRQSMTRKLYINSTSSISILPLISPSLLDDYSDESASNFINVQLLPTGSPTSRSMISGSKTTEALKTLDGTVNVVENSNNSDRQLNGKLSEIKSPENTADEVDQVQSEQWIVYERYLYERYLDMVSQSIDLILHTILASWMALLLDEDSDQCFGTKPSKHKTNQGSGQSAAVAPTYNYNGVRYSIRPDMNDSPARVVVRR